MRKTWTFAGAWYVVPLSVVGADSPLARLAPLMDSTLVCGACKVSHGLTARKERQTYATRDHYGASQFGNKIAFEGRTYSCALCNATETATRTA